MASAPSAYVIVVGAGLGGLVAAGFETDFFNPKVTRSGNRYGAGKAQCCDPGRGAVIGHRSHTEALGRVGHVAEIHLNGARLTDRLTLHTRSVADLVGEQHEFC